MTMKKTISVLLAAVAAAVAQAAEINDPTEAADAMADALRLRLAEADGMKLHALVAGADGEGVALVGADAESASVVKRGSVMHPAVDGVRVSATVKSVSPAGVEIESSGGDKGVFLAGSFSPLPPPAETPPEFLRHLESEKVPIGVLMRLVSDRTGVNISVSGAASSKKVSIFLRNVSADAAVEEICRATGLWFRRDNGGGRVVRVTTMAEYAENLDTFREEKIELFTLLYPNVVEAASVIYGLYPDRTLVSLGEEEFEEDGEYDLSRRFRRFRAIDDNGNSQFMGMEAPQTTGSGSRTGSGTFSFSRGAAASRLTQWDQLRERMRRGGAADAARFAADDAALVNRAAAYGDTNLVDSVRARSEGAGANIFVSVSRRNMYGVDATLGADDAELMEEAWRSGDTNLLDRVKTQVTAASANIFVSMSRKNNMLVVRTSDVRVMDEIRAMVKKLDVPTPMVLMEVKVLELAVDDNYEASFQYSFNRGTHTVGHDGGDTPNVFADVMKSGQAAYDPTFAFKAIADNITAQITLLQQDGKVNTLATPTLLVANNEVARIFSGKEYPLVTGWRQGDTVVTESGIVQGNMTVEISKEDVGTMLLITPNINADKTVTLHLMQENSVVSPEKVEIPVDGGHGETKAIEYVESRSLTGTFIAKDGMTVMAGGLVKETEKETYWRTPVLGSIPLLGWLFRGTEKVKERTELVILIKPHVILTPMEGGKVSAELMEALSAHPAADGRDSLDVHKPAKKHDIGDDFENIIK